jgi:TonB family protein
LSWYTSFVLLPEIDLRCRRRLAEVFPICPPDIERRRLAMPEPATDRLAPADPSVPQAATSVGAAKSQSGTPSTVRLVIRIRIPEGLPSPTPAGRRLSRGALLLILGAVAVLLSWVGISMFRTDPTSAPAVTEGAPNSKSPSLAAVPATSEAAPAVTNESVSRPAIETAERRSAEVGSGSTEAKSVESQVREQPHASPSPTNEVIPDVPRSARETIRGTVRVSVRVIVDKDGAVLAAIADDPGPSRYFERLAVEASKKWTFTPSDSQAQRIMLVRFNFRRSGTTARASSLQ